MKKRFTDADIRKKAWFRKLPPRLKEAWRVLCDQCDDAGVWEVDIEMLAIQVGEPVTLEELFASFNVGKERIVLLEETKLYVRGFAAFQYGPLKPSVIPHKRIIKLLKSRGLYEDYLSTLKDLEGELEDNDDEARTLRGTKGSGPRTLRGTKASEARTLKEEDKDKEEDKEEEKEEEEGGLGEETQPELGISPGTQVVPLAAVPAPVSFEDAYGLWRKKFPGTTKGPKAEARFEDQIATHDEFSTLIAAIENYAEFLARPENAYRNPKTSFQNFLGTERSGSFWHDYRNPVASPPRTTAAGAKSRTQQRSDANQAAHANYVNRLTGGES